MLEAFHDAAVSGDNIFTSNCRESGRWEGIGRLGSLGEEWQLNKVSGIMIGGSRSGENTSFSNRRLSSEGERLQKSSEPRIYEVAAKNAGRTGSKEQKWNGTEDYATSGCALCMRCDLVHVNGL